MLSLGRNEIGKRLDPRSEARFPGCFVAISSVAERFPLFYSDPIFGGAGGRCFSRAFSLSQIVFVRKKDGSIFLRRGVYIVHGTFMGFLTQRFAASHLPLSSASLAPSLRTLGVSPQNDATGVQTEDSHSPNHGKLSGNTFGSLVFPGFGSGRKSPEKRREKRPLAICNSTPETEGGGRHSGARNTADRYTFRPCCVGAPRSPASTTSSIVSDAKQCFSAEHGGQLRPEVHRRKTCPD